MLEKLLQKLIEKAYYLYDYQFFYKPQQAPRVVKLDRTFVPGFDFYNTPDGKDLRLSNQN